MKSWMGVHRCGCLALCAPLGEDGNDNDNDGEKIMIMTPCLVRPSPSVITTRSSYSASSSVTWNSNWKPTPCLIPPLNIDNDSR